MDVVNFLLLLVDWQLAVMMAGGLRTMAALDADPPPLPLPRKSSLSESLMHERVGLRPPIEADGSSLKPSRSRERQRSSLRPFNDWSSKAYEDESVFMSEAHLGWQ